MADGIIARIGLNATLAGSPSATCFAPLTLVDTGLGFKLASLSVSDEFCAVAEAVRLNTYLDWSELVQYTVAWACAWLLFHVVTRNLILVPLAYKFLPVRELAAAVVTTTTKTLRTLPERRRRRRTSPPIVTNGKAHGSWFTTALGAPPSTASATARLPSPAMVLKFVNAGSKFLNYTIAFVSCMWVLTNTSWWSDSALWWDRWLARDIEESVKHYYYFYLGFYVHQVIVMVYEPRMKDFTVMAVHHAATIALILFSFTAGYYRNGLPYMLIHDVSDPFMEIAKVFNYSKAKVRQVPAADIFFIMFAIVFFISRLVVYPRYLLWTALFEAPVVCNYCKGVWLGIFFSAILQVLHIYWMSLILKMVYAAIVFKGVQGDIREEDEDDDD